MVGQGLDGRRELHGDARADNDDGGAGQHRAVERRQVRHLDLFQEIDSHRARVSLPGQKNLDEIRGDAQLLRRQVTFHRQHFTGLAGRGRVSPAGNEIGVQNPLGHTRKGEVFQGPANAAVGVAVLQAKRKQLVQGRAGHDAQLAQAGHGPGQPPVGDAGAHAALNDRRDG